MQLSVLTAPTSMSMGGSSRFETGDFNNCEKFEQCREVGIVISNRAWLTAILRRLFPRSAYLKSQGSLLFRDRSLESLNEFVCSFLKHVFQDDPAVIRPLSPGAAASSRLSRLSLDPHPDQAAAVGAS
jgi:hypothetical protein